MCMCGGILCTYIYELYSYVNYLQKKRKYNGQVNTDIEYLIFTFMAIKIGASLKQHPMNSERLNLKMRGNKRAKINISKHFHNE